VVGGGRLAYFTATPDNDVMPYLALRNKRFLFHFDSIGDVEPPPF